MALLMAAAAMVCGGRAGGRIAPARLGPQSVAGARLLARWLPMLGLWVVVGAACLGVVGPSSAAAAAPTGAADPDSYYVPDAWADKARQFVEPGPDGLEPGLPFESLETGRDLKVTFKGKAGRLVLRLVPSALELPDAVWTGRRVTVLLEESTLSKGAQASAIAHFGRIMTVRESGWGWLRRDPKADERQAAAEQARVIVGEARRLAMLGRSEAALTRLADAIRTAPTDATALAQAARVVYAARRPSRAKKFAEAAIEQARKSVAVDTLAQRDLDRVRVVLASALALAQQTEEAVTVAQEVVGRRAGACDVVAVARDLEVAGAYKDAVALAATITDADYRCDEAWALRVDLARWGKDAPGAQALATQAVERRNEGMQVRSAGARAALAAGVPAEGLTNARVPVQHTGGVDGSLVTLLAVVGAGGADALTLERWDGELARSANETTRGPGVASCWNRGAWPCVITQLAASRQAHPSEGSLAALHAIALVRQGEVERAPAALAEAWASAEVGAETLAAEAEVAEAEGRTTDAVEAWTAYLAWAARSPGPVTMEDATSRLRGLQDAVAHAPGRAPVPLAAPTGPAPGPPAVAPEPVPAPAPAPDGPPWAWIVIGALAAAAAAVAVRARGARGSG